MMNELYKKLKFPESVNIMGVDYLVKIVDEVLDDDNPKKKLAGQIRYADAEILIYKKLNYGHKWQTLFHEIMHGVFDANHLNSEEETIDLVANGLMCMFFNSSWSLK